MTPRGGFLDAFPKLIQDGNGPAFKPDFLPT